MKTLIFVAAAAFAAATPTFAQPAAHTGHNMPQAPATQAQQAAPAAKAQDHAAHEGHDCKAHCEQMKADGKEMNCHGSSQAGKAAEGSHQGHGMSH